MATGTDHISIPAALLWAIMSTVVIAISGGSYWLGGLSQRVMTVEEQKDAIKHTETALGGVNARLDRIEAQLAFVIHRDFPGQQGDLGNGSSLPDLGMNR